MGAARSSNVAEAITNITNSVSNSTSVSTTQTSEIENNITIDNCQILLNGNFNAKSSAKVMAKNNQIVTAKSDSNLKNNIAQQVSQTSTSTVGAGGIGFAEANNSCSTMVNSTSQIMNAMMVGCSQYSQINNNFTCNGSTVKAKNLNTDFKSEADFISTQTLDNSQIANITNTITQGITQTATATVEGISGLIFMIVIGLAAIFYTAMKPLSSPAVKNTIGALACLTVIVVTMLMYLGSTPPFFNENKECINNSSLGLGADAGQAPECINQEKGKISLAQPPLKYIYGISPTNSSLPGANLVQMAISVMSGQNRSGQFGVNGGYTVDTYKKLKTTITNTSSPSNYPALAEKLKIPNIPNPLYYKSPATEAKYQGGGNPLSYFRVPLQYGPNSDSTLRFNCTPGTIQVGIASDTTTVDEKCPNVASPAAWDQKTDSYTTNDPTQGVANLNIVDWNDYLNMTNLGGSGLYLPRQNWVSPDPKNINVTEQDARSLFARFVLCDIIGTFDLHYYISSIEPVKFSPTPSLAKDVRDASEIYFYHPYTIPGNFSNGFTGSGYLSGYVGVINDSHYKFNTFMQNYGGYVLLGLFVLIIGFIFIKSNL